MTFREAAGPSRLPISVSLLQISLTTDRDGTMDIIFPICARTSTSAGTGSECSVNIAYNRQIPICSGIASDTSNGTKCRGWGELCVSDPNYTFSFEVSRIPTLLTAGPCDHTLFLPLCPRARPIDPPAQNARYPAALPAGRFQRRRLSRPPLDHLQRHRSFWSFQRRGYPSTRAGKRPMPERCPGV